MSIEDIRNCPKLDLLAYSDIAGVYAVADKSGRQIFLTGHGEYERNTLKNEYLRDMNKGLTDVDIPYGYFPDDDPTKTPPYVWRTAASLLYSNWLNFCVYQETPYTISRIQPLVI